jgi:carboxylate-amine ligase
MSTRNTTRLRAAFDTAALSLTVGAEEEVMLVDPRASRLLPVAEDLLVSLDGDGRFQAEFRAAVLEIVTRPYLSAADVGRELALARVELDDAASNRARLLACGTHPTDGDVGPITEGERYGAIATENPWAARHMLTCGLHIHVAVADADRALAVCNALRSYLPEFTAIAANSPYHRSADAGVASTRYQLNRYVARHGVPPAFRDWNEYAAFVDWGRTSGSIPDTGYHWWDLRLHPGYGTIELRACDTQTDSADAAALVGLAQTLVASLAGRYDAGERLPVHDSHRIAESCWLGARTGAGGMLLELETGVREPTADRIGRLVDRLAPVAVELGTERELARVLLLARASGADEQRRAVNEHGSIGLVDWLANRTLTSARTYLARAALEDPGLAADAAASGGGKRAHNGLVPEKEGRVVASHGR